VYIYKDNENPLQVGLALSYAAPVVSLLNGFLTTFTEMEKEMISVERVVEVKPENIYASMTSMVFSNNFIMLAVCWYTSRRPPGIRIS
jgi:hypothetical protein